MKWFKVVLNKEVNKTLAYSPPLNFYLFYNDYETSYTSYNNHARWHRCLRSGGLRVRGNRSTRRKPTYLTR